MDREYTLQELIERETRGVGGYYLYVISAYNICSNDAGAILREIQRVNATRLTPDDTPLRRTVPITPPRFNTDVDRTKVRYPGKVGAAQDGAITYSPDQESFLDNQTKIEGL